MINNVSLPNDLEVEHAAPAAGFMNTSCVSISDYTSQYMTQTMKVSDQKEPQEQSVPLFHENRSKSVNKQRRTRRERYNEKSSDRLHSSTMYRKSSVSNLGRPKGDSKVTIKPAANFESKIPTLKQPKSRTAF